MRLLLLSFLIFIRGFCLSCGAQATELLAGTYVREYNSGSLVIKNTKNGPEFHIESVGSNCHSCSVAGIIKEGIGYTEPGNPDDSNCRISFKGDSSSVNVEPTLSEACRQYCGMRAYFNGIYKALPPACTVKSLQARRNKYLTLYKKRQFSEAVIAIESLLKQCASTFMDDVQTDRIRNDLALTQYHSGDPLACQKTLSLTRASDFEDEAALRSQLPPCDFDNYISVAKATWHNQALCEKPAKR